MSDDVNDKGGKKTTPDAEQDKKTNGSTATSGSGAKAQGGSGRASKSAAKSAGVTGSDSATSSTAGSTEAGSQASVETNKASAEAGTADAAVTGEATAKQEEKEASGAAAGAGASGPASRSKPGSGSAGPSPSAGPSSNPEQVENTATVAAYVVGAITGLMYLLAHRDKPKVRFHASRSVLITLVIVAAWVVVALLDSTVVGIPLVLWAGLAFLIYMAVMAFKGTTLEIPFLRDYVQRFSDKMSPK